MFTWTEEKKKTWFERFSDQPHQLFFAGTLFFAIVSMILSMFSFIKGIGDFATLHGFGLIYGVFTNAFLGFLLTVIPRYTQGVPIQVKDYIWLWILFEMGVFCGLFISDIFGSALLASALLFAFSLFGNILLEARIKNQIETIWLVFLVFIGAFISFWSIFSQITLHSLMLWCFVLPVVFTVAQRMIPAFFSVYFQTPLQEKPLWFLPIFIFGMFAIGLLDSSNVFVPYISSFLFVASVVFLSVSGIYKKSPPILWILTVGFTWLPIGFLALAFEGFSGVYTFALSLHILTLGFIFTLLIGFGTRVILGHSKQKIEANKLSIALFIMTQIIVISRIIASVFFVASSTTWTFFIHFGFSFWVVLFMIWSIQFYNEILRIKN